MALQRTHMHVVISVPQLAITAAWVEQIQCTACTGCDGAHTCVSMLFEATALIMLGNMTINYSSTAVMFTMYTIHQVLFFLHSPH